MTAKAALSSEPQVSQSQPDDGRRQRSSRSRRQIIEAMFELLREGEMAPTAAAVAARANVGLRTVFRHFEDKESIFEEMIEQRKAAVLPRFLAPLKSETWQDRVVELATRNGDVFEDIFPMRVALIIRRFESDVLQKQYQSEVSLLRSSLTQIVPREVIENRPLFAAIEVNLTFATWRRLREDQNLSVDDAKATLTLILNALLAQANVD